MGKGLMRVVGCSSGARSGLHGIPLPSGVRDHANPPGPKSCGFHRANHGFLRNLTLPFAWFGTCCRYRRVSGAIMAGLDNRTSVVFHIQQTSCIAFPEEKRSESRCPDLLVTPMLAQNVRGVHMAREELEVNGSRCDTLTCVVVREGMVTFPQR